MTEYDSEEFVNPCVMEKLAATYEKDEIILMSGLPPRISFPTRLPELVFAQ